MITSRRTARPTTNSCVAIVALVAHMATAHATAHEDVKQLLDRQRFYDELCRGMLGDDLHMVEACNLRNDYERRLNAMGWCFGRKGQTLSEIAWHECRDDSLRR